MPAAFQVDLIRIKKVFAKFRKDGIAVVRYAMARV